MTARTQRLHPEVVRAPSLTTTEHGYQRLWSGMPAAEPRYCVAEVTEEARDGWEDFANRVGVNRTVLAEVIGLRLGDMREPLPRLLERWVEEAKGLQGRRFRRRG